MNDRPSTEVFDGVVSVAWRQLESVAWQVELGTRTWILPPDLYNS